VSAPRLTDGLLRWATERPDALAVEAGHAQWSYAELAQRAQAWAARLGEAGIEPGHRVGLCCEKSAEALAAVYGLLLRGAVHVPLDPDIPPGRLAAIEQRCQLSLVLRDLDGPLQPTAAEPGDGAYILFTSGSTGLPRGVVHSHASGMAFVDWAVRTLAIGPQDRLISWASWQFDLSLLDLFGASMAGATLVIPPPQLAGWQPGLGAWLEQQRISLWYTVPTAPVRLLNEGALPEGGLPALRRLVYAGEPMDPGQAQALQRRLPQTTLYNFYGPTETNVVASYRLPPLAEPLPQRIPIGGPASSARLTLDDGELLVSGPSVMRGYWGEPPVADPYRTGDLVTTSPEGYVFLGTARPDGQAARSAHRAGGSRALPGGRLRCGGSGGAQARDGRVGDAGRLARGGRRGPALVAGTTRGLRAAVAGRDDSHALALGRRLAAHTHRQDRSASAGPPARAGGEMSAEIRQALFDYLATHHLEGDSSGLDDRTQLFELGILDSVGVVRLVTHLERTYGFEVADEEFLPEDLATPGGIVALVKRKTR